MEIQRHEDLSDLNSIIDSCEDIQDVAVEVGGTNTSVAIPDKNGTLHIVKERTRKDDFEGQVSKIVNAVTADGVRRVNIGMCLPGLIEDGVVLNSPNIPSIQDSDKQLPLAQILTDLRGVSHACVDNDAVMKVMRTIADHPSVDAAATIIVGTGAGAAGVKRSKKGLYTFFPTELGHVNASNGLSFEGNLAGPGLYQGYLAEGLEGSTAEDISSKYPDDERLKEVNKRWREIVAEFVQLVSLGIADAKIIDLNGGVIQGMVDTNKGLIQDIYQDAQRILRGTPQAARADTFQLEHAPENTHPGIHGTLAYLKASLESRINF